MTTIGLFVRIRDILRSPTFWPGVTIPAVLIGVFQMWSIAGLRINTSPSLPVGLYITTANVRANLVEFCPAEPFASFSIARGYRDRGACGDGAAPLLKPVVASAGDVVDLSARGISVNGVLLPNTAPLSKDSKSRPLTAWIFGHYVVAPGTVWVASSYHPRSFDSRYFGPVSTSAIRHRIKPFLTL
jgi:conjugative transfer signal peptidase TraF